MPQHVIEMRINYLYDSQVRNALWSPGAVLIILQAHAASVSISEEREQRAANKGRWLEAGLFWVWGTTFWGLPDEHTSSFTVPAAGHVEAQLLFFEGELGRELTSLVASQLLSTRRAKQRLFLQRPHLRGLSDWSAARARMDKVVG